ncbi:hypothetical protein [Fictibacillus terranigra]|uniref:Uncharacterized protein n=1 Tax=Fictibacillus terranigra TaxID=3058424 RepID=A0ABT8EA57_9BACL|nr:hypothetical protein [Fictibacillus sp. CENA-BCM004]MDN4074807.1 hypothetical protein [Fictibacillus sp. CENA-BCM004]
MEHILDALVDLIPFLIFIGAGLFGLMKKRLERKFSAHPKRTVKKQGNASSISQPDAEESKGKASQLPKAAYQQARKRAQEAFPIEPLKSNRYKDRSDEIITMKMNKENIVQGIVWSEILGKPRAYNPLHIRKK